MMGFIAVRAAATRIVSPACRARWTLSIRLTGMFVALGLIGPSIAQAQSTLNLNVLQGLVPFSTLLDTAAGRAALASNYTVTAAIQTGTARQPLLVPFAAQRDEALKDAFVTSGDAFQLADGLGTQLGGAYQALTSYVSNDDGKTSTFSSISTSVATLIAYTAGLTSADSAAAKTFFGNATTVTSAGAVPISKPAADMLASAGGTVDIFGKAYHHPAGSAATDPNGDSRPFQTESTIARYAGFDYFGVASRNVDYLTGPTQDLVRSPSFPSGHTTYGYTESLLLAVLLPQRFSQLIARAAEYGNDRIILGAHYAMDVIAGRSLAYFDVAHLLASSPSYVGRTFGHVTVNDYPLALAAAKADLIKALSGKCGVPIDACAAGDRSRFRDDAANEAFYEATQTYGLPVVYQATNRSSEDIATFAPEAGYILTTAFPKLTLAQADRILTETEGPGGGFLDDGSAFGVYSRLDLFRAAQRSATFLAGGQQAN
jgi:membrane-associated phospholipid phosphatase